MSIRQINEGFKSRFENVLRESSSPSAKDELRSALEDAAFALSSRQIVNLKAYEVAFQEAIEKLYPDNAWWEITDCNIFWDLFENRDIDHTINEIINQLKINTSIDESLDECDDCVGCDATLLPTIKSYLTGAEFKDIRSYVNSDCTIEGHDSHGRLNLRFSDGKVLSSIPKEYVEVSACDVLDESKSINESIDDVKKIKQCIQSWVTGKYDAGGQNSAYFAKWLAESEAGLDWEKIAEVAYLMGYDVYKSSYGYFGDEDYLIVYPGHNPEMYTYNLDDEYKAIWEDEVENGLVKVESFNSKSTNEDSLAKKRDAFKDGIEESASLTEDPDADGILYDYEVGAKYNDMANAEMKKNAEYRKKVAELKPKIYSRVPEVKDMIDALRSSGESYYHDSFKTGNGWWSDEEVEVSVTPDDTYRLAGDKDEGLISLTYDSGSRTDSMKYSVYVTESGEIVSRNDRGSWSVWGDMDPGKVRVKALELFLNSFDEAKRRFYEKISPNTDENPTED